jgi:hypothetical protein
MHRGAVREENVRREEESDSITLTIVPPSTIERRTIRFQEATRENRKEGA